MTPKAKILIWGIFIAGFIWNGNGKSLDIHDGTVHTEREKTLIRGSLGMLTCRFTGSPYAVFWKKGHDIWTSPTLIQWTPEDKTTGPRYDDGSCDMDENYSLIIKSVNHADRGRFICLVSNEDGILVYNYTDVTVSDDALEMESSVTLPLKQTGFVPCQVNIRPRKVSWFGSKNETLVFIDLYKDSIVRGGTGIKDGLYNITGEYSLVIYNVKIQHEGLYACVLTDYDTGIIYQDDTLLSVIAQPMTPFPAIQGCTATKDHGNCILNVDSTVEITCNANRYYPDIGLYFKLGSENVASLVTQTWINTDGTRNKSVTIVGYISNEVYICVAFEIPGVDGNRSTSVRLIGQNASLNPAVIIVPIVFAFFITTGILTMTVFYRRRKTPKVKDLVSYAELWKLVELAFRNGETDELDNVVKVLCNFEQESQDVIKDAHYYYSHLCTWKETTKKKRQRKVLKEKLQSKRVEKTLKGLRDYREMKSAVIAWFDLKHALNEIGEREKIAKFLESLGIDLTNIRGTAETTPKTFIQEAVGILQKWTKEYHSINPAIILSSILEKLNHESANNFFHLPDGKKQVLNENEWKSYIRGFSRKHADMLSTIFQNVRGDSKPLHNKKVLREDCEVLFNTENMLRDWWREQQCSYFRRRWMLDDALIVQIVETKLVKSAKPRSSQACPDMEKLSKEELCKIVDYFSPKSRNDVFERLGISPNVPKHADGYKGDWIANALWDWRLSNEGEMIKMNDMLLSALRHTRVSMKLDDLESIHLKDTEISADDGWLWPSDNEVKLLVQYIDTKYTAHVREHLKLTNFSETANRNDLFNALCAWRKSDKEDFTTKYKKLVSALNETNISGLLSPLRMDDIHKAEYVEIAFNLLMTDVLPVAKHLGIDETKLSSYRPAFEPSHLQEGTIGLVSTIITSLDKNKQRAELCKMLKEIGFPPSIQLKIVAFQMSFGEISSIFNALKILETSAEEERNTPQPEPKEGDHLLPSEQATPSKLPKSTLVSKVKKFTKSRKGLKSRPSVTQDQSKPVEVDAFLGGMENTATPMEQNTREAVNPSPETKNPVISDAVTLTIEQDDAEPPASSEDKFSTTAMVAKDLKVRKSEEHSPHLGQIKKMLNLTDEFVSSFGENDLDEFTLFRIWKEKIQFSALNERAAVVKCMQDSRKTEIGRSVIEGKFIPDEISLPFINHIVKKAKANSQLEKLAAVLGLKKDYQQSQGSVDNMSEIIQKEFRKKRLQKTQKVESKMSNKSTEERDVSISTEQDRNLKLHVLSQADKLVEHGFLDLACELLIIYHL